MNTIAKAAYVNLKNWCLKTKFPVARIAILRTPKKWFPALAPAGVIRMVTTLVRRQWEAAVVRAVLVAPARPAGISLKSQQCDWHAGKW